MGMVFGKRCRDANPKKPVTGAANWAVAWNFGSFRGSGKRAFPWLSHVEFLPSVIFHYFSYHGRNPAEYWILKTMGSKLGYLTTNDFSALEDALLVWKLGTPGSKGFCLEVSCNGGSRKSSKSLDHFSFETYSRMILGIPHFQKPPYNIMFRMKIAILKILHFSTNLIATHSWLYPSRIFLWTGWFSTWICWSCWILSDHVESTNHLRFDFFCWWNPTFSELNRVKSQTCTAYESQFLLLIPLSNGTIKQWTWGVQTRSWALPLAFWPLRKRKRRLFNHVASCRWIFPTKTGIKGSTLW